MRILMPRVLAVLAPALLAVSTGFGAANVVFIMADDLGWNDVGYHGSEIWTPHIDSIANRGLRLDRYYASPLCSPTRAAFLTGRNPLRLGIDRPIETKGGLPLDETLLPQVLAEAGYQTAMTGKWHLGLEHINFHPYNRGFASTHGHLGPGLDYWTHIWDGGLDWHRDGGALEEPGYSTRLIGGEAQRVIRERDPSRPLFLYVAFNAPHAPLQAPPETAQAYGFVQDPNRRTYAAMVSEMDGAVGEILKSIEDAGISESTLLIWCSDNGGAVRLGADNSPLRGGKGGVFEGGIRLPAAIWHPGVVEGGREFSQMMTAMDWLPTIASATGIRLPQGVELDGRDMWPALTSGAPAESMPPFVVGVFNSLAVIDGNWKYVEARRRGGGGIDRHLFRIDRDPGESRDIAESRPDKLAEMAEHLRNFPRAATVAPDVLPPGGRGRGPRGRPPEKAARPRPGQQPGRGGGAVDGWKEITKPPWVEAAKRD